MIFLIVFLFPLLILSSLFSGRILKKQPADNYFRKKRTGQTMNSLLTCLTVSLFISVNTFAAFPHAESLPDSINDGPYIFYYHNKLEAKWIENNIFQTDYISQNNFPQLKKKFNLLFEYKDLLNTRIIRPNYKQYFTGIDSFAAISDIHGEYEKYIRLLKSMKIIDENLNWIFGKGHLVVLGDSFDRGDMVTELLWHLYGLEKQALLAGGMVHVLLGNHETMLFNQDTRYANQKYVKVQEISGITYFNLYSEESVLGQWLRNQPVILLINDIMFVHAGISIEMVRRKLDVEHINRIYSKMLLKKEAESSEALDDLSFILNVDGPFWYRGFFTDQSFCETKTDSIFNFYDLNHIVVGHTTGKEIKTLFDNKVFGIDAGLGSNLPGAMLIYKDGSYYQGLPSGARVKF